MRIKRLEVYGFKSFKDKTVIHFDAGITGVVGPNGCGKSNIVDAFFWSLGEQNPRLLRGLSMEDLIFNGSDKAPPANMAEVTLVLEVPADIAGANAPTGASYRNLSSTTKEMAVTRRLYRSGDSEYFINKVPCRLRDIQELFMDTGVGSRSYSIIQQGMIGKIVQAKPEERRQMIEDVAGVVKYKKRRQESLRKLDSTRQNLLRVTDVVTEIEKQKRQMERQAEKAQKYRQWKQDLESSELKLNSFLWEKNEELLSEVTSNLNLLNEEKLGAETERETIDTKVSQKRLELESAAKVSDELQNRCFKVSQNLTEAHSELKYKNESVANVQRAIGDIDQSTDVEKERIEVMQQQYEQVEEAAQKTTSQYEEAHRYCQEVTETANHKKQLVEEKERAYREVGAQMQNARNDLNNVKNEITISQSKLEDFQLRKKELGEQKEGSLAEKEQLVELKDVAEVKRNKAAAAKEVVANKQAELKETIRNSDQRARELQREANQKEALQTKTKTELESLVQQRDRHEGSGKGVQTIFNTLLPKSESWQDAIKGSLSDLISVEAGKETPVEAVLGKQLDAIVTDSDEVAIELLEQLKEADSGRAYFLKQPTSAQSERLFKANLGLGPLRNFVEVKYIGLQPVLDFLLADTYLCENARQALALAADNPEATFVTMEGEIVRQQKLIEGGAKVFDTSGAVLRNQRIETLENELAEIDQALSELQERIAKENEVLAESQKQLSDLEDEALQVSSEYTEAVSQLASAQSRVEAIDASLAKHESAVQQLSDSAQAVEERLASAKEKEHELGALVIDSEQEHRAIENALPQLRIDYQEAQSVVTEARIRETSLLEQKNASDQRLAQLNDNLEMARERIETLITNAKQKSEELAKTQERITELQETIESLDQQLISSEEEHREAKKKVDGISAELEEFRKTQESASNRAREISEKSTDYRVKQDRYQLERENLQANTFERYGIELSEYVMQAETREQIEELRTQGGDAIDTLKADVLRLKGKIQKLGGVNESAIEEFEELTTRYEFLETQRKDLESAMKDLEKTIDKINKVSKERFNRAFEKVNSQFTQVFPALFGGGSAKLTLTNPEDMLETGVDIMAQPPGKKLQNINLLSGGEKTLTAISLLFAIFLVRPSPFCLLDEVDAPLDDANIGRFNALLKQMAKLSQFIIITHNKRTMELNDRLYGVTMEDAGISKMVSIQMTA